MKETKAFLYLCLQNAGFLIFDLASKTYPLANSSPLFKDSEWQGVTMPTFFGVDRVWLQGVEGFGGVVGG
jgi:hypothetical protein